MPTNKELQDRNKALREEKEELQKKLEEAGTQEGNKQQPNTIHLKIVAIREVVDVLKKDTVGHGYKYVATSQILKAIKEKMDELKVLLYPEIPEGLTHNTYTYVNQWGDEKTDWIVDGFMNYIWQNAEDPTDKIVVPWYMKGQQNEISKAFGSGLTYAERYFLLKFFGVPTDEDDPDNANNHADRGPQKRTQQKNNASRGTGHVGGQKSNVGMILSQIDELSELAAATKTEVQNRLAHELGYDTKTRFKEMDPGMQAKVSGQLKTWILQYKEKGGE